MTLNVLLLFGLERVGGLLFKCMLNTLNAGSHSNGSKVGSRFFSFTREYLALSPSICLPRLSEYLSRIFSGLKG